MPVYKLKAPRKYGDMQAGYEFQVSSSRTPYPSSDEIQKELMRLGFNKEAQSYKSSGNWKIEKN